MNTPDPPRTVLRHYEVLGELGRGGMGVVYEGLDRRDDSKVAIKALHPYLAAMDQGFRERFEREAHIAALLRSPYTVHLLDFGVEAGQYLLVMEFVEGKSLATLLEQGPIEPVAALQYASEVARALEEAAARGVVHRDIKPDNILVESDGRVKVTDFGIARQSGGSGSTQAGSFVGTAAYAAPEQADGEADTRTDIYALGATLYCMLAGEPPYRGRTAMEVLYQHRTTSLPMAPLAALPDSVQNIVRRCLEKDPRDRYTSPSELASALERARAAMLRTQTELPRPAVPPPGYLASRLPSSLPGAMLPKGAETLLATPLTPVPDAATPAGDAPPAGLAAAAALAPDATALAAPPPQSDPPGVTALAGPHLSHVPVPEAAAPPKRKGPGRAWLLAASGAVILVAAAGTALFLTKGSGSKKPANAPSPTAALVARPSGTAGPATSPSPAPPTVFPPASAHYSILASGAAARVVDSVAGADGQCPVSIWTQPSDAASATNSLVQRLCNGDQVTVGTEGSTFASGATWWKVTDDATKATGWVEEVTADGTHRYLALSGQQFSAPESVIDPDSVYTAIVITPLGSMTIELYADQSPRTVNNFVFLAEKGFYDGTTFFHLQKSVFIEGGDPTGTGNGDAGYQLAVEGNTVRNVRGAIAMSSVVGQFGSKFFIYASDNPSLDFDSTALTKVFPFGKVTSGLDVLDKIASSPTQGANLAISPVPIANIVIEQRPK